MQTPSPALLGDRRDSLPILALSALFLLATACTFTSLGVVLPRMRQALGLSWSQAGLCFTAMALGCGATAYAPSWLIARIGVRRTAWTAAAVFAAAFLMLAAATGAPILYAGCALAGFGFSLAAPVLGEFVIARASPRPAMVLGVYYAAGSMGGVIGPWLPWLGSHAFASWRTYWLALAACVGVAGVLIGLALREPEGVAAGDGAGWSVRQALRSPPLYILWAGFLVFLAAESTLNTFAFAHLAAHGVGAAGTTLFLSASALAAVGGRALGGVIADRFDAKGLLIVSLAALSAGLFGLALPGLAAFAMVYALLIGFGFGASLVASTVLLLRYYGVGPNLSLFGMLNTAGVGAAFAPLLAGRIKDAFGSFDGAMIALGLAAAGVLAATVCLPSRTIQIQQPKRPASGDPCRQSA